MKLKVATMLMTTCFISSLFAAPTPTAKVQLKTDKDRLSYALGVMTGQAFRTHAVDIKPDKFAQGFQDSMENRKLQLTQKAVHRIVQNFQLQSQQKAQAERQEEAKENLVAGKKFLAENKKHHDVITMKDGLQYKVLKNGSGQMPAANDEVTVNYEGKLLNGKMFDSSYERGKPASFQLNQVIKGWQQALQMMQPGAVWKLYIPADLAYGEEGAPGIGPNQVLVFKVELLSVKKN